MKVFISWSGERSKAVASKLHEWLKDVMHEVDPWMSEIDIGAGERWSPAIDKQLGETRLGILCLTPDNAERPWVLFEAGALAKTTDRESIVCPYLLEMNPEDVPDGPLTNFKAKRANKSETWDLVKTINSVLDSPLAENRLKRTFDRFWPDLEDTLNSLPPLGAPSAGARTVDEMVPEILETVRGLSRRAKQDEMVDELARRMRQKNEREAAQSFYPFYADQPPDYAKERYRALMNFVMHGCTAGPGPASPGLDSSSRGDAPGHQAESDETGSEGKKKG